MHHTLVNYQKIYEKLGYLFYALAAADNVVPESEADRLREMVKKIWLPIEDSTDEFGTDAGYYIDISFEFLLNEGIDAEEAFQEFENYYLDHSAAFSKAISDKIRTTAKAIAQAFRGKSKRESALLKRLDKLLV
jgi:hypothetical protein